MEHHELECQNKPSGSAGSSAEVLDRAISLGSLDAAETYNIKLQLWHLLASRTERFTMSSSSSVPVETAKDLLASITFCVGSGLVENGDLDKTISTLKKTSILQLFENGRNHIEAQIEIGMSLFQKVLRYDLPVDSLSYRGTLKEIALFFKKYDPDFFAHDIPCMIDYQLCNAVPDLQGIEYINEYLLRIDIENRFCSQFDNILILSLLQRYCPDYSELLINIFEPIMTNAIGLVLLEKDPFLLDLDFADRSGLVSLFTGKTAGAAETMLLDAAEELCRQTGMSSDPDATLYIKKAAAGLSARVLALSETGCLDGIFLSISESQDTWFIGNR